MEPDILARVIADGCRRTDGRESGSIDCVVLNACNGTDIARELFEKHSVQMVIYWDTQVDDEAAKCFSEGECLIWRWRFGRRARVGRIFEEFS